MPERLETEMQPAAAPGQRDRSGRAARLAAIAWFSLLYLPVTLLLCSNRAFWNDELFTYYIARQPGFAGIWNALTTGGDQNPPPFYWLSRLFLDLPGDSHILMRLPEVAGFGLLCVCLAAFVWRRLPPAYGLLAALLPLATGGYLYAYEARPYGAVAGFGALALLCWQRAGEARPLLWSAALAASLAAAVSMHYYAVLLFLPLAGAELVRSAADRRVRPHLWAALILGAAPLAVYYPLIRVARTLAGTFWAKPAIGSLAEYLFILLSPALPPVMAIAAVTAVWHWRRSGASRSRHRSKAFHAIPGAEVAAVLLFLAIPVFALALAFTVTGAFTFRYALPGLIGAAAFGSWIAAAAFGARTRPALLAAALLTIFFLGRAAYLTGQVKAEAARRAGIIAFLSREAPPGLPIAIADPHLFFELSHAAPQLRPRLVYFAEPRLALQHLGTDAVDRTLAAMAPWAPLHLGDLQAALAHGRPFLIYGHPAVWDWLVPDLIARRTPLSVIGTHAGRLLLAAYPAAASSPLPPARK